MEIKGTKSEQNLKIAFAGESQARNKYTYYAMKARKQGYEETAQLFEKMADNEKEHAKIWFNFINGIRDTEYNLLDAAQGEHYEWTDMYEKFAEEARGEGLDMLADMFERVAGIEKDHERRFMEELSKINKTEVKGIEEKHAYRCGYCGYTQINGDKPTVCPVCGAMDSFDDVMVKVM